jgi:glycosyltransferase involved in cell wall biosynthesis
MQENYLISICIPAYRRTAYLKRVLDSIAVQTFRDFEVIVTDDSMDDSVNLFLEQQVYHFPLKYIQNKPAKGTPLNWMEGMNYAKGEWIKIIHDDDWLTNPDSLQQYANAIVAKTDCIFSGYIAHYEETKREVNKTISQSRFRRIQNHPYYLFASNEIGPPSVVMFRKTITELYDPSLKWLVDLEAYVRMLKKYNCVYISKPLITMSYNATQVTNDCFRNPDVEIKEALIYYAKAGDVSHARLLTYDAWWRLLRNLSIRSEKELLQYAHGLSVPPVLFTVLKHQKIIPPSLLKIGLFSKLFMFVSKLLN